MNATTALRTYTSYCDLQKLSSLDIVRDLAKKLMKRRGKRYMVYVVHIASWMAVISQPFPMVIGTDREFDVEVGGIKLRAQTNFSMDVKDALMDSVISISSFKPKPNTSFIGDHINNNGNKSIRLAFYRYILCIGTLLWFFNTHIKNVSKTIPQFMTMLNVAKKKKLRLVSMGISLWKSYDSHLTQWINATSANQPYVWIKLTQVAIYEMSITATLMRIHTQKTWAHST